MPQTLEYVGNGGKHPDASVTLLIAWFYSVKKETDLVFIAKPSQFSPDDFCVCVRIE